MGRKILFITTDQQRFDSLGCNGGTVARTPTIDALANSGIRYTRAQPQNVVCMPSRSTMLTGQHPSTHGVWMNGVPLPIDAPSIAEDLWRSGYRTALIGKAHFEPFLDPFLRFAENRLGRDERATEYTRDENGTNVPHRGFEHLALSTHGGAGPFHYARWLANNHPEAVQMYYQVLDGAEMQVNSTGGGDTDAPQVKVNPIPRDWYHTTWVAERTKDWLASLDADADWFCWMSFPDPHHPWDPPQSELHRVNWRDLDLPAGFIEDRSELERVLEDKPRHWKAWWEGKFYSNFEPPRRWVPSTLTADQTREVNAMAHIMNEMIDEAIASVMSKIDERGWGDDVDVIFTTDHGEFQGDFNLLFKGPYHVDSLMRLPLIWRPAPSAKIAPQVVDNPVGLVSLAATFADIAGLERPEYVEAARLPVSSDDANTLGHEQTLTEWDSVMFGKIVSQRTILRDGWVCSVYGKGTMHDGTEGELYNLQNDPLQRENLFDAPAHKATRDDLIAALWASQPPRQLPLRECDAPV